jgi:bromodomain and PHD finger-containing protein 1
VSQLEISTTDTKTAITMVLDFDIQTFCTNLKATKPPYECPIGGCGKVYKSYSGIHFHLLHHNDGDSPAASPKNKSKKGRKGTGSGTGTPGRKRSPSPSDFPRSPKPLETLTYAEAQRMVEIELDGRIHRLNIFEPLEIISQDEIDNCDNAEKENREGEKPHINESITKSPQKGKPAKDKKGKDSKGQKEIPVVTANNNNNSAPVKLPEAIFTVLDKWVKPSNCVKRSSAYYRFMEKTNEELDEDIEYDMDEEV